MTPWKYEVATGKLYDPSGECITVGYSGLDKSKNKPDDEGKEGAGPIPRGKYTIGAPYNSARVGPFALPLEPVAGTNTFGRSAFRIHGDSIAHPGSASHGCIIVTRVARQAIANSNVFQLEVI